MARPRILDLLQNYPFWLLDIVPSARPPFFVLGGPLFGFSGVAHPEIQINHDQIDQLNQPFPEHVFRGASVNTMTLQRGARFYDSSMYLWIDRYIQGEDVAERDLLLIQHMGLANVGPLSGIGVAIPVVETVEIVRLPGKAWILWDARPVRYTPGPGLEALSSAVSVSELDVQCHSWEEFSLDPFRIADAAAG